MALEVAANLRASGHIECGERLVEQKKARVWRERAGEGHALALTSRQRIGLRLRVAAQPNAIQPSSCFFAGISRSSPA